MINNKLLLALVICLCSFMNIQAQIIFNSPGGGAYPGAWTETNNIVSEPIDKGTYYMVQPGSPGDNIITSAYDLSANLSATFSVDIQSFGSGGHNSLLVDVSTDGGATYTQNFTTAVTTTTYATQLIAIPIVSSNMVIRLLPNGTSGRGIRMQNLILTGIGSASTATELNFASATYSVAENGTSINICVDIIREDAVNPTTADIVLTTGGTPHITYATTGIVFPAGSTAQQCVTIPITDNSACPDGNNYTFEIQNIAGGNTAVVGSQNSTVLTVVDDEGSVGTFKTLAFEGGDDWTYTGGGAVSSTASKFYGTSSYAIGGTNDLTTANIDISTYNSVSLNVVFASTGADSGEDLFLDISYDNGTTWTGTGSVKLVDGFGNANLNVGDTNVSNPTTVASNPWTVSISDTETQIRVRLRTVGLDGGEFYYVDDIILSGDSCPSCTPTHSITSFNPTSGPELTEVTIIGTGFTAGSTVDFGGISATIISQTATELVVEVPFAATTGAITVTEATCDLDSATDFTIIADTGACTSGGSSFTDIFISEVTDSSAGSLSYVEIYNGTGADVDLTDYAVRFTNYNNTLFDGNPPVEVDLALTGTLINGDSFIFATSVGGSSCSVAGGDGSYADQVDVHSGVNNNDCISLIKLGVPIDIWGACSDTEYWTNVAPLSLDRGYDFQRKATATAPTTTFDSNDWTIVDFDTCSDNYTDIETYAGSATAPNITTQPLDVNNCDLASVNITVVAGGSGGTLTYLWRYNDGVSAGWSDVTSAAFSPGTVTGETSTSLTIFGFNVDGYQFYCEVTEDGTCSSATDAIQVVMQNTVWDGATWSDGAPDINTMAIIDGAYDTSVNGNFTACSLIINRNLGAGLEYRLTVADNTFVEVENNVTVDGELYVQTQGAFVQVNDAGAFVLTANGMSLVNKSTTPLNTVHDYTYWSSPVTNSTVQNGLAFANPNRIFWFNAANFLDVLLETANTGTYVAGSDGIDDDANDWTFAAGTNIMTPGVGYVSNHTPVGFIGGTQYTYTFTGEYNTGIITTPILYNGANGDEDWNLIGNPYPSAIDANAFLTANAGVIGGAIYLWSHNTAASATTSGNEGANFSQNDYAIITNGSGNTAGGDGLIPNDYVPSGQSFFVQGMANGNVTYNNAIRMADGTSNSQFFKTSGPIANRIWVNLTSDNGVFNQVLVAYVDGATNGRDNLSYDARRSLSSPHAAVIYSKIENDEDRFAIQGKAPESLTLDEVIPLGLKTTITVPTIYSLSIAQVKGLFFESNTVYLKDLLLDTVHNLSDSDYSFTSEEGDFSNRFEIVFKLENSTTETTPSASVSIVELENDMVQFIVPADLTIRNVKIYDVLGKLIYNLRGTSNSEIYSLSNLSQAAYIAQIELSNGDIISKKTIKK